MATARNKAVSVRRIRITPQKAEEMLATMGPNRSLKQARVSALVADMIDDRWQDNGETIKLAKNGKLIDGQHRLEAIIRSGKALPMLVAHNVPSVAMVTIDTGAIRSFGDHLQIVGTSRTTSGALSGALSFLWTHEKGGVLRSTVKPTHQQLHETLELHPDIRDSVEWVCAKRWRHVGLQPRLGVFLHYVFSRRDPDLADLFFDALHSGENIKATDPVYRLRERMIRDAMSTSTPWVGTTYALIVKAWNFTRRKLSPKVLKWMSNEEFPEIE